MGGVSGDRRREVPLCSVGVEGGWASGWPVGWLLYSDAPVCFSLCFGVGGWAACCWRSIREAGRDLSAPGDGWLPARGACWCVAMRVDRLECWGGLRGRAGWDDGLEELEEASFTSFPSLESLRASWLMPGPETGFADCRKAGGGQGAGALLRCRTEDLVMMIRIKSAGGTSYAVAWGRITCPSRNAKNGESTCLLRLGNPPPPGIYPPGYWKVPPGYWKVPAKIK